MQTEMIEPTKAKWSTLYKIGAGAAISMVSIILIQLVIFIAAPPPFEGSALDWFSLFQRNALLGLIAFELLMVVYVILSIPLALALFVALRHEQPSLAVIFLAFSLLGTMAFIVARPAFEMLAISQRYAAATGVAQQTALLAAGETMLAIFKGTAFQVSYYLGSLNGLVIAVMLFKSKQFSKATAYTRLASSVFDFGILVPVVGIYISILSVLFMLAWNILIARRLTQLSQG